MDQPPESYVLKCSSLMGVNEGNEYYRSLINLNACEPY
jgi:hypothetical protein